MFIAFYLYRFWLSVFYIVTFVEAQKITISTFPFFCPRMLVQLTTSIATYFVNTWLSVYSPFMSRSICNDFYA